MSAPRPSTDIGERPGVFRSLAGLTKGEESASLLRHDGGDEGSQEEPTFLTKLADIADQPLTVLSKILLAVCFFLLLLTSIFIGLFSGAEHKLNNVPPPKTTVSSVTQSYTITNTFTETSVSTTTDIVTTTTTAVPPVPTVDPRKVCMSPPVALRMHSSFIQ